MYYIIQFLYDSIFLTREDFCFIITLQEGDGDDDAKFFAAYL